MDLSGLKYMVYRTLLYWSLQVEFDVTGEALPVEHSGRRKKPYIYLGIRDVWPQAWVCVLVLVGARVLVWVWARVWV